jgi:hypothetical protein
MTTAPPLARCPAKGCPVRYRGGPDRPCPMHQPEPGIFTEPGQDDGLDAPEPDIF